MAETLEKICRDAVQAGFMTKDLAILIGPDTPWLTTNQFLDKLDEGLKKAMGVRSRADERSVIRRFRAVGKSFAGWLAPNPFPFGNPFPVGRACCVRRWPISYEVMPVDLLPETRR